MEDKIIVELDPFAFDALRELLARAPFGATERPAVQIIGAALQAGLQAYHAARTAAPPAE